MKLDTARENPIVHEYTSSEARKWNKEPKVSVSQDADCGAILKKA